MPEETGETLCKVIRNLNMQQDGRGTGYTGYMYLSVVSWVIVVGYGKL